MTQIVNLNPQKLATCNRCNLESDFRVLGIGYETAKIFFINDYTLRLDDKYVPYHPMVEMVGDLEAKETFLEIVLGSGIGFKDIYITNLVKCQIRKKDNKIQQARNECFHWIESELVAVKPEVVIALGAFVADFFGLELYKIEDLNEYIFTAIEHPRNIQLKKEAINWIKKCKQKKAL